MAAKQYLKKVLETKGEGSLEASEASQQLKKAEQDQKKLLLLLRPKKPAPIPQPLQEIQTLAKELDGILNTLEKNISLTYLPGQFKKYFDREFPKVKTLLQNYEGMVVGLSDFETTYQKPLQQFQIRLED
jgi:hypothetical protein